MDVFVLFGRTHCVLCFVYQQLMHTVCKLITFQI